MDNTKTNRAALVLLQQACGQWIVLGCAAHAIALIIKDLASAAGKAENGVGRCPGFKRVYDMVRMISNAVGDSEGVRMMLHKAQVQQGGKPRAIGRHVPTRFAVLHLITLDILASENSLKVMVSML